MSPAKYVSEDQAVQPEHGTRRLHVSHRAAEFGPWLTTREAQVFLRSKSLKATYEWIRKHRIIRRSNGTIARRDLERELAKPRKRRVVAAASLQNLRQRVA